MKVLFLNPPSFDDFDGGAGSRYQAIREVRSFWYPTWLAYPAGLLPDSRLLDAPAAGISKDKTLEIAMDYDLVAFYTSTPSLRNDIATAEELKRKKPSIQVCFVGPHTSVLPEETLKASPAIDFVTRREFDHVLPEYAKGKPLAELGNVSFWKDGKIVHNPDNAPIQNLDELPFVAEVYKRDLRMEDYEIPWMLHPYVSIYTGRGCISRCTFCLWPQTFSGNFYRQRSADNVAEEVKYIHKHFPGMRELFFEDDTFTDNRARAKDISNKLKPLGLSWGCNAKVNVDYETLRVMRESGFRVVVAGFETGSQKILSGIKKGTTIQQGYEFAKNCKKLGIHVHGTFIVGLPGETRETIRESIRYACEMDLGTIQVSLASPYPGTKFYDWARTNGFLTQDAMVSEVGYQTCNVSYPEISNVEIFEAMEKFYNKFYFRPQFIARTVKKMIFDPEERRRRLKEGYDFLKFMSKRKAFSRAHKAEFAAEQGRRPATVAAPSSSPALPITGPGAFAAVSAAHAAEPVGAAPGTPVGSR
ncbi:MAG: hopanoid biosynthesis associated radical SAM protein HpnJ [Planctomycetes bacterium]|nr:hopanoid biosynthesis associated radical SAM protein HpnJ [Planctomycetota bacterium]